MRYLLLILLLCIVGCTSPTQPVAAQAFQRGQQQADTVVLDLSRIDKQGIVDKYALAATTRPAAEVVALAVSEAERVSWLQLQYERARSLLYVSKMQIDQEQGALSIWWEEAKQSWAQTK